MSETDDIKDAQDSAERPLVTFALFAYNQEKYIREAVEGAFSQTYEPLEIILSDDCSTDRTFEIMQEMAREYRGRHTLIVRKSSLNRGLLGHMNDVARICNGSIVVAAAGDDISFSNRVSTLTSVFRLYPEAFAVASNVLSHGTDLVIGGFTLPRRIFSAVEVLMSLGWQGLGASFAYRRDCFFTPSVLPEHLSIEDHILPLRATLLGCLIGIRQPLVSYRTTASIESVDSWRYRILPESLDEGIYLHLFDDLDASMRSKRISRLCYMVLCFVLRTAIDANKVDDTRIMNLPRRATIATRYVLSRLIRKFTYYLLKGNTFRS